MVPTSSDTAKFLDGDTFKNSQALAFAVAALQAMPSSSETAEISRVFSSNKAVSPMTMVPLVTKPHETTSEDNAVFLLNAEESLATEQRAGSGTQEGDEEIALESSTKTKPTPAVEAATVFSAAIVEVETEHDAGDRLQRSRERNREHARRTRLRKKAQMQALQIKYKGLLAEKQLLEQKIQDRSIASILLGLSSQTSSHDDETAASFVEEEMSLWEANRWTAVEIIRRKRGSPELPDTPVAPVTVLVNGVPTPISCKTHINWKSGTCSDEQGHQKKLTLEQLETLRWVFIYLFYAIGD